MTPAVVLAGGVAKPDIVAVTGQTNRALIPIEGRTMLERVVGALADSGAIGEIAVVGGVPESDGYRLVADAGGFVENIYAGLAAVGPSERALLVTADIPFLTADAVRDMVGRGSALQADMVYPVVRVEDCLARFPGVKRTSVKLREGRFTGGNMVLARVGFMEAMHQRIAQAYALRKSPARLALVLGLGTVVRFVVSQKVTPNALDIPALERSVSRLLGGKARGLITRYAEVATDIDRAADLEAIGAIPAQNS